MRAFVCDWTKYMLGFIYISEHYRVYSCTENWTFSRKCIWYTICSSWQLKWNLDNKLGACASNLHIFVCAKRSIVMSLEKHHKVSTTTGTPYMKNISRWAINPARAEQENARWSQFDRYHFSNVTFPISIGHRNWNCIRVIFSLFRFFFRIYVAQISIAGAQSGHGRTDGIYILRLKHKFVYTVARPPDITLFRVTVPWAWAAKLSRFILAHDSWRLPIKVGHRPKGQRGAMNIH